MWRSGELPSRTEYPHPANAVATSGRRRPRDRASRLALLTGPLGTVATGAFLLATQHGYLSVAGILASLYPAGTVLLATAESTSAGSLGCCPCPSVVSAAQAPARTDI